MAEKVIHDIILGRKRSDGGLTDRITSLEDTYVSDEWYSEISAGTGTITPPTGAEFVLDSWPENVDAVVSTISTGTPPDIEHAREADGTIVTTSFDAAGDYVLSGVPSAYPVAIIYRYRVKLKDYDDSKSLNAFKLEDTDLNHIIFNTSPSGVPAKYGALYVDEPTRMPAFQTDIPATVWNAGLEDLTRIRNETGVQIADGAPVFGVDVVISPDTGEPTWLVVPAVAVPGLIGIPGIATSTIDHNKEGYANTRGDVKDYDCSTFSKLDFLYLPDTPGPLTIVPPTPPNYAIPVGYVKYPAVAGRIYIFADNPVALVNATDAAVASGDPTGWHDEANIDVAYDSTTRKTTLTGNLKYSWRGQVKELTSPWVSDAHDTTLDTGYFLYSIDGENFVWATSPWEFSDMQIVFVWHGTSDKFALREVHGLMPWQAHEEYHQTVGTYRPPSGGGGDLAAYVLDSTTAADRRPTVSATTVKDEDIRTINALLNSSLYTKAFLTGTGALSFTVETADIVPLSVANPYYNEFSGGTWGQTLMTNNSYMSIWLIAVPVTSETVSQKYRYIWMQGQTIGTLLGQQALFPEDLALGDLADLFTEFVFISQIIIRFTAADWTFTEMKNLTGTRNNTTGSPAGVYLSSVSHDATLVGNGTASDPLGVNLEGYDAIQIPAGAMIPATTNGAETGTNEYGTNDQDFDYFAFDSGATEERVMFAVVMPEEWDGGTVKVKARWSSATGSTTGDTVEWGIKGVAIGDSDALDVAQGTPQVISDILLADNGADLQVSAATPAITIGGTPAAGKLVNFEIYRNTDGTDDMAEDAWLFGVVIQYQRNSVQAAW